MRPAAPASALLWLVSLSGCLGGGPGGAGLPGDGLPSFDASGFPVPVPLCHDLVEHPAKATAYQNATGRRCDFEMTPDEGRSGNEATIAVNPRDPRNVVGGAKDYYPLDAGQCVWNGVYVTHDGARTDYADRSLDGSPWRLLADPGSFQATYFSQFWCTTDPVAVFGADGSLYYLLMAYQADPVTASRTCEDVCPPGPTGEGGALNDWAINRAAQVVAVSDDGGDTFHTVTPVMDGSFPVNLADKGWIAVSHDGTVHVMWISYMVPGNLYCRSTDGARTFLCTEVVAVQFLQSGQGSFLDVGTSGQVYAAWYNDGIRLKRSLDHGETWGGIIEGPSTNVQEMPGLSPRDRRGGYPAMATDRNPDSPFADSVYFVWSDACGDPAWRPRDQCDQSGANSIYFSASHDGGSSFTQPVRVSAVEAGGGAVEDWSIFPTVSVSPGGVIDVSWMETRGARTVDGHETFEQHYAYSLDGGDTWAEPFSVRDAGDGGWDPALSFHQNGMVFIGDYNDIDSSWQAAHPVWPDTRDGHADVYTATLQRPVFAEGWDEAKKAEALEFIEQNPV